MGGAGQDEASSQTERLGRPLPVALSAALLILAGIGALLVLGAGYALDRAVRHGVESRSQNGMRVVRTWGLQYGSVR